MIKTKRWRRQIIRWILQERWHKLKNARQGYLWVIYFLLDQMEGFCSSHFSWTITTTSPQNYDKFKKPVNVSLDFVFWIINFVSKKDICIKEACPDWALVTNIITLDIYLIAILYSKGTVPVRPISHTLKPIEQDKVCI